MRSDATEKVLLTIEHNITLARRFLGEMTAEEFAEDDLTIYAVTRCLEIISEASLRLPAEMMARHVDVPWQQIAGAGNIYRHDDEDVLAHILWHTVRDGLGSIDRAIERELTALTASSGENDRSRAEAGLLRAQALYRKHARGSLSADDFLRERKAEAARDDAKYGAENGED